ncbi:MAG: HAMP domain-containing protein [Alphaproteobacteria bacterium]|nr:HAMP domain-containing protein [Alphaproteobacteria bacterium]
MAGLNQSWPLKNLFPKGLFARSLLIVVAPVVLLQAIITYIFFERHWDTVTRRLSRAVAGEVAMLAETYSGPLDGLDMQAINAQAARTFQLEVAFLPGGEMPAPAPRAPYFSPIETLKDELAKQITEKFWIGAHPYGDYLDLRIQMPRGVLRVLTPRNRVTSQTAHIFILWMLGSSLVLLSVAVVFLRNQVRPIALLAQAAEDFGKGRDVPEFKVAGALEVRQAAAAFLEMRDRIGRQIAQRTLMLAGVSHDLRTPLTRMNLQLAMLPESEEIEALRADIHDMQYMLDEYLAFAGGQSGESESLTSISQLIEEIVSEFTRNGAVIKAQAEPDLVLPLRRANFKRCIVNLLENAHSHGEHVEIRASRTGDHVLITIDDDGPGIQPENYEEAFLPFQRLDDSRNPDRAGVGLGLAIARDVARSHGGDIELAHSPLGGLRATIRTPL